jgi:hypothetical protein
MAALHGPSGRVREPARAGKPFPAARLGTLVIGVVAVRFAG